MLRRGEKGKKKNPNSKTTTKSLSEGCRVSNQNSHLALKISVYDYYFIQEVIICLGLFTKYSVLFQRARRYYQEIIALLYSLRDLTYLLSMDIHGTEKCVSLDNKSGPLPQQHQSDSHSVPCGSPVMKTVVTKACQKIHSFGGRAFLCPTMLRDPHPEEIMTYYSSVH